MQVKDMILFSGGVLLMIASFLSASGAWGSENATPLSTGKSTSPEAVIEASIQHILKKLDSEGDRIRGDSGALYALVNDTVVPHLDMTRMSRAVLGKWSRTVDADAFQRFSQQFQTVLVNTYATSLNQYTGEKIDLPIRTKHSSDGKAAVNLEIRRTNAPVIQVEFRMHSRNGPWLVYDIRIEAISLVANYRSEFSSILRKGGIETLITQLKIKNQGSRLAAK
jgi:phospholipid transport system substrate-binding protein